MKKEILYNILTYLIATVWLVNGLVCKVMDLVPRHQQIVANILGAYHSRLITILIGISEIGMAIWVLTKYRSKLNAMAQMIIVGAMNILEFIWTPELLLWGKLNSVFALMFIALVYYKEFVLGKEITSQSTK